MVQTVELLCVFNRHHIADIFHNTNHMLVAGVIAANLANVGVGNVMTDFAVLYLAAQLNETVAKIFYCFNILPQQKQHEPQRAFATDSGQFREFVYCVFK